jgi:hypothetical protein
MKNELELNNCDLHYSEVSFNIPRLFLGPTRSMYESILKSFDNIQNFRTLRNMALVALTPKTGNEDKQRNTSIYVA